MLQSTRARFNQYSVEETCPLCRPVSEDLSHMLLRCPALANVRKVSLGNIRDLVVTNYGHIIWSSLSKSGGGCNSGRQSQAEEFPARTHRQRSRVAAGGSES